MGKYWKRRMDSVLTEYNNWRIYYKSHYGHMKKTNQVMDDIDLASMISDADLFINAIMTDLGIHAKPLVTHITKSYMGIKTISSRIKL